MNASADNDNSGEARRAGAILTVDLDAVVANYRILAGRGGPGVACAAVVKADAYGLGMARVAPALVAAGCRDFFVAQLGEGTALRGLLPEAEVTVLGGLLPEALDDFVGHGLVPTLNSLGEVELWAGRARAEGRALRAVLHVDTGMRRLGLPPGELDRLAAEPERLAGIDLALVMSHLACADTPEHPLNALQLAAFRAARSALPPARASFANSSGIFLGADNHFDLLRPGISLYGGNPDLSKPNPMRPAVRLRGRIWQVREAGPGETVGYGATRAVTRPSRIATVAAGYADGYPRALTNRGRVVVGGREAPILGRVSMDAIMIDVSDVPPEEVAPGGFVDLIGPELPVDEVARAAGTIANEILTGLGARYHRVYLGGEGSQAS